MTHLMHRVGKALLLSVLTALLLTAFASAAEGELAVAVGCTTGTSLRLRESPATSSAIITQLDKGVAVAVLDNTGDGWYKINYDGTTGFVSADFLVLDKDNVFTTYGRVSAGTVNVRTDASTESESAATIDAGAVVTVNGFKDGWYDVTCQYGTKGYIRSDLLDLTRNSQSIPDSSGITALAKQYLGVRYSYGGASPSAFDCSGFTMYIYGKFGYSLPHTATGQWQSGLGSRVYSISALQPGDLVFFNDPSRNAGKACSHAGIYVGGGEFIHASSAKYGVVYSDLTSGYYNRYFVGGIHV